MADQIYFPPSLAIYAGSHTSPPHILVFFLNNNWRLLQKYSTIYDILFNFLRPHSSFNLKWCQRDAYTVPVTQHGYHPTIQFVLRVNVRVADVYRICVVICFVRWGRVLLVLHLKAGAYIKMRRVVCLAFLADRFLPIKRMTCNNQMGLLLSTPPPLLSSTSS